MKVARWCTGLLLVLLMCPLAHAAPDTADRESWLAEAQRDLAQIEYRASTNDIGLQAPNRAQGFRTYFDETGIRLVSRSGASQALGSIELSGVGRLDRDGRAQEHATPGAADVSHHANQVTLRWPGVSAQYDNRSDGLHQTFTVERRPPRTGRVSVVLDTGVAGWHASGGGVLLRNSGTAIRIGEFEAHDAQGRSLPVVLSAETDRLLISIDDRQASYPITVKSLVNGNADAVLEQNQAGAQMGFSVAGAGDLNGDGFSDVVVGALRYDNGQINEGAAFVYLGGAGAFDTTADARLELDQTGAQLGVSVAGAGDVNGDGFGDLVVGADLYDNGEFDEGAAFIYFGGAGAFNPTADAVLQGNQLSALAGRSVAGAGDVNGDGFADVIVGAPLYDNGQPDEGAAFLYLGNAGAFNLAADALLESDQPNAELGVIAAGAGDVNGDGFADVIVGAGRYDNGQADEGAAFVYFGASGAFNPAADAQLEANQAGAQFGISVAGAGDLNGDGFADVLVGAPRYDNGQTDEGAAFIYLGSAAVFDPTADALLESNQLFAQFGISVAGAGDVNGDGYADVLAGAILFDNGPNDEGAAFLYRGGAGAFDTTADALLERNQAGAQLGFSVAGAGDVNGDGFADVIVGADLRDAGEIDEGSAFVYFGGAAAFRTLGDALLEWNQISGQLGLGVSGAGDVNGDGFSDVIVGAPFFDNGQFDEGAAFVYFGGVGSFNVTADAQLESNQAGARFGFSVAGAGDVNADGYADVIVGAETFDNQQLNEGAAFVFFGGAGAFETTADAQLEANQASVRMGYSVAGAGDVNGDGFADVIAGAHLFDNGQAGEGVALLYFGCASAFDATPDARLESNQAGAQFGVGVGGAGDVNGDGFADVVVGADLYDNGQIDEGAVFVYFGGAGAFNTTADAQLEVNQATALLGRGAAGAGDVNGDGFDDLIVSAPLYDNGEINEGAAFIYFGGGGVFDTSFDALLQSGQVNAQLGFSVAGAGDVNADGFADVIVGAVFFDNGHSDEGAAFVYHGGAGFFSAFPDALLESNQADSQFGVSVAGAGDVNGDGFADVVVGAFLYDNGQADEGTAFIYHGTARGRLVLAGQYRGDGTNPVQPYGLSRRADGFVVALEATSPRGRERVRLQVEACPNGAAFGSLLCAIRTASTWTDLGTEPLGSTLVLPITGLSLDRVYHWRARVQYAVSSITVPGIIAPGNPSTGPWRRLHANAGVADIRISAPLPEVLFVDGFE